MARDETPPFPRGHYDPAGADGTTAFDHLVGREWQVEDVSYKSTGGVRTPKMVTIRLVKNVAGFNLLPKRLVRFSTSNATYHGGAVDGYSSVTAEAAYPVDEYLPSTGVPDNACFYIVTKGPATVLLPLASADFGGNVSIGDRLVALTAATSGATGAGRVARQDLTTTGAALANQIQNAIGRALSAVAANTTNAGADLLIHVGQW
jgi:hypothetical protein